MSASHCCCHEEDLDDLGSSCWADDEGECSCECVACVEAMAAPGVVEHVRFLALAQQAGAPGSSMMAVSTVRQTRDQSGRTDEQTIGSWAYRAPVNNERLLRVLLADAEADLDAERAKLRRWQLRLRWRAEHRDDAGVGDRLRMRERIIRGASARRCRYVPIAGPRGALP